MKEHIHCPVTITLNVVGGKWKLIILWQLTQGTLRFSELERRITGVTQKMLSQQLKELEADRLIVRKVYPQIPPKVEYSLSRHGQSLQTVLEAMSDWGEKHQKYQQSVAQPTR